MHAALKAEGLVRWTKSDIPDFAEEPYVVMAAFLAGPEYTIPVPGDQWAFGLAQIRKGVQLQASGPVMTEYF